MQCPLEVVNLRPSRDVAVLDFSFKFGTNVVIFKNNSCLAFMFFFTVCQTINYCKILIFTFTGQ